MADTKENFAEAAKELEIDFPREGDYYGAVGKGAQLAVGYGETLSKECFDDVLGAAKAFKDYVVTSDRAGSLKDNFEDPVQSAYAGHSIGYGAASTSQNCAKR